MVNDLPNEVERARYLEMWDQSWREGRVPLTHQKQTPLIEKQGCIQKRITKSACKKVKIVSNFHHD